MVEAPSTFVNDAAGALDAVLQQLENTIRSKGSAQAGDAAALPPPDFGSLSENWKHGQMGSRDHLAMIYAAIEFQICQTEVEDFESYESCFEALNRLNDFFGNVSNRCDTDSTGVGVGIVLYSAGCLIWGVKNFVIDLYSITGIQLSFLTF